MKLPLEVLKALHAKIAKGCLVVKGETGDLQDETRGVLSVLEELIAVRQPMQAPSDPVRRLVYRFHTLSLRAQVIIASDCGLIEDTDGPYTLDQLMAKIPDRAAALSQEGLARLWDETEGSHRDPAPGNPFRVCSHPMASRSVHPLYEVCEACGGILPKQGVLHVKKAPEEDDNGQH